MTPTVPSDLTLRDSELGHFAFYTWQNIAIACWSQRGTGPSMQRFARLRAAMDREHPEGVSVLWLIADGAGLPTPEARASAKELMERYRDKRACLAVVIYGEGFWVSAMRAVITGVLGLIRSKIPLKIFNRVEEVIDWFPARHESLTGVRVLPEPFLRVLRECASSMTSVSQVTND